MLTLASRRLDVRQVINGSILLLAVALLTIAWVWFTCAYFGADAWPYGLVFVLSLCLNVPQKSLASAWILLGTFAMMFVFSGSGEEYGCFVSAGMALVQATAMAIIQASPWANPYWRANREY